MNFDHTERMRFFRLAEQLYKAAEEPKPKAARQKRHIPGCGGIFGLLGIVLLLVAAAIW